MNNRELIYPEFEKMFLDDNIEGLESSISRSCDKFVFSDLLYDKLIKSKDKEKVKKYIKSKIFDGEFKLQLILNMFNEEEVTEILLENIDILVGDLETLLFERRINAVELFEKVIKREKSIAKTFLQSLDNIGSNLNGKVKQILQRIGKEEIKEFLKTCNQKKKIKAIITILDDLEFVEELVFDKELVISDSIKQCMLKPFKERAFPIYYKCIEQYELFGQGFILECLKEIGDKKLVLKCLCDNKMGFSDEEKIWAIFQSRDAEFQKECLETKKLKFNDSKAKVIIICEIGEKSYAEKCIGDKTIGLEEQDIEFLKLSYEIGIEENMKTLSDTKVMLKTPKNSTKGIEIESNGKFDRYIMDLIAMDDDLAEKLIGDQKWRYAKDGSGIELSSYVMADDETATNSIYHACNILKKQGHAVTNIDGGHVHIGTNILTNVKSYKNLLTMWFNLERAMFLISNQEGELPRENAIAEQEYAKPTSFIINQFILDKKLKFHGQETVKEFIGKLRYEFDKFCSINLGRVGSIEGSTIEYRTPNGTLDPKVWIQNINFFSSFTQSAEDLYQIQAKAEEERTEKEKTKLQLFQIIKSKEASETEKLESLLGIMLEDEEQRSIYRNRYNVNSKLLEKKENNKVKVNLEWKIAEYFIGFDAEEIGEYCFEETGAELEETARNRLQRDKAKDRGTEFLSQ